MRRHIRTQQLLANTLALVVVFSVMSVYLVHSNTRTLRARLKSEATSFSVLATSPIGDAYSTYKDSGTAKIKDVVKNYLAQSDSVVNVHVISLDGTSLFSYDDKPLSGVTARAASSFEQVLISRDGQLQTIVEPYFNAAGAHRYGVVYTISNQKINQAVQHETLSLLLFSVLSLVVTSGITYFALNTIVLKPLQDVSRQAEVISKGNLDQQINIAGDNEISSLGRAVNVMADSLKHSIVKLREVDRVKSEFLSITSHNLRTPLAVIEGNTQNADVLKTPEQFKEALARIAESAAELHGFAEEILTISQFELGNNNKAKESVVVSEFMKKLVAEATQKAASHRIEVTAELSTNDSVYIDATYLRNAVFNLLDNAIKFTPEGGKIHIRAFTRSGNVHIAIQDTGIGIAKEEVPKLFTKFHRATSTSEYNFTGTGIGLYVCKIIVEDAGGTINVDTVENHGSTFTVSLPVFSPHGQQSNTQTD